jgi:hypothetical protein
MELLIIILFIISLAINILLILRGISLVNEYTLDRLESMLNEMRAIDLKGSFESDDEVGVVFTELKDIIEKYKNTL